MKQVRFQSFLVNVFKPTVIVLWFWVAVLFVSLMNNVLVRGSESFDLKWTTITSIADWAPTSGNPWDQTYTTIMDNNLLNFTLTNAWKTILEFILSIVTVMIVYLVIGFTVKMWDWKDFVSKKIGWLQEWLWNLMGSTPIIPVPWYDKNGQKKISGLSLSGLKWLPEAAIGSKITEYQKKVSEQTDDVMKMRNWSDDNYLSETQRTEIRNAWIWPQLKWLRILEAKRDYIKTIRTSGWKWMKLKPNATDKFWQTEFSRWLTYMKDKTDDIDWVYKNVWKNMINRWNTNENDRTLEKMFKENGSEIQDRVKAYAEVFGLKWDIKTWEDLMDKDISSTEDTQ